MSTAFCIEQDGAITIHTLLDSAEPTIDDWAAALSQLIDSTPPDRMFLVLMDVSASSVSLSRYARQKSFEVFTRYKNHRGRLAFLFSSKTAPHFARIFFASLEKLMFERDYFSSRQKALDW